MAITLPLPRDDENDRSDYPERETQRMLPIVRYGDAPPPELVRALVSASDIAEMATETLDRPEIMASLQWWLNRWANDREREACAYRRHAADVDAEIASMDCDAIRCWEEFQGLVETRKRCPGGVHPHPQWERRYQTLCVLLPDLDAKIERARLNWQAAIHRARELEDAAALLRRAAQAERAG